MDTNIYKQGHVSSCGLNVVQSKGNIVQNNVYLWNDFKWVELFETKEVCVLCTIHFSLLINP